MKKIRMVAALILAILLIIQLFQPDRNLGERGGAEDLLVHLGAPAEVGEMIQASCYDCHSDHTHYPWYGHISPISLFINKHVEEGKEAVNFSSFAAESRAGQIGILSEICEVVEQGNMPLQSYLLLHGEAALDEDERAFLCDWADSESLRLLNAGR